ncbi:hypothetical protein [Nostoc sp. 'Peltigera malacea cyanobiont' DB3992]|uniref:hypothetical protein n=1 Tax=Nostoc sp. 'Peltigera malacea cyanobiont' DB3992 TaxID=1206980 RepID=UPI000C03B093|nr:hypothetical protein [Nostoc sp. 'Peltigera malacea cyanobiont' DB3992]PHM05573.1 hypothetical protein CK516_40275 [Nostoc sp. 'Peltigera malacea cyanobiont' DB3992]
MKPEIYAFKEGFKILLSKAPIGDPKLKYRKEVEIYASRGEISIIGRRILDALRQNLGLLPEETAPIETEVLKPYRDYQQKLQEYEQALVDAIGREPTLSDYTRNDLRRYQEILELRDEDVAPIEVKVIESGKALKTQPVSAWHFPFLPPQVQPQHRVEIPSQPESSSSHQVTTPKTHKPIIAMFSFCWRTFCNQRTWRTFEW